MKKVRKRDSEWSQQRRAASLTLAFYCESQGLDWTSLRETIPWVAERLGLVVDGTWRSELAIQCHEILRARGVTVPEGYCPPWARIQTREPRKMKKKDKIATVKINWALASIGFVGDRNSEAALMAICRHMGVNFRWLGNPDTMKVRRAVALKIGFLMKGAPTISSLRRAKRERRKAQPKAVTVASGLVVAFNDPMVSAFYESWEWKRLRYEFMKDQARKCECCGAKAPDVRIVVDHVKPIRKFWNLRLDRTNLQALCDDCNRGKGSTDMTDWRRDQLQPIG